MRQDGLGVKRVNEIDGFVVAALALVTAFDGNALQSVGAMKDYVTALRLQARAQKEQSQWNASPLSDGTPAFHTVGSGNLGSGGQTPQFRKRVAGWTVDEAVDNESPGTKPVRGEGLIVLIRRCDGSVCGKLPG